MRDQKNIDRLFQEKLEGFEQQPRPEVWSQIQGRMQQKKKKRIVPFWWWYAGSAAVVVLSLFLLTPNDSSSDDNTIIDPVITVNPKNNEVLDSLPKKQPQQPLIDPKVLQEEETLLTDNTKTDSKNTVSSDKKKVPQKSIVPDTRIAENVHVKQKTDQLEKSNTSTSSATKKEESIVSNSIERSDKKNTNAITDILKKDSRQNDSFSNTDTKSIFDKAQQKDSLKDALTDQKKKSLYTQLDEELIDEKTEKRKWSVRPLIALSTVARSSSSPTDEIFRNNSTSGNSEFNYGVSVSYRINEKLSVQTGVLTQNVNFDTERVSLVVTPGAPRNQFRNINLNGSLPFALSGSSDAAALSDTFVSSANVPDSDAQLNQAINYIEIPVEIKYNVTNSEKLSTSIIGGFSSLFLSDNEIILDSKITGRQSIGTASNLNSVNFSGNFGIDLDYKVYKKLYFNVNPMVKVHLNTFSRDNNGYLPVFIGVYSGIKYRF